jgi:hypothetical protein
MAEASLISWSFSKFPNQVHIFALDKAVSVV